MNEDNPNGGQQAPESKLWIVGIGASAGGLEALNRVLPNLPIDPGVVYIIAQHLDPHHKSMLKSLLAKFTAMPILEVTHGKRPLAGKIYITPPGHHIYMQKGFMCLEDASGTGPKPSVNHFFASLAEEKGDRAIGIILSGTGSDGAIGIRSIKAGGGITIVQQEETAKYNGMPNAAIRTRHVDLVIAPEGIGEQLASILEYPDRMPTAKVSSNRRDLDRIYHLLIEHTDTDFSNYKLSTIRRRIQRRMALHKFTVLGDYVRYLEDSPAECQLLFKEILISVTSFFRDPAAFDALVRAIRQLVRTKNNGDRLRVWVPAAATGEETYSIAILVQEALQVEQKNLAVHVFSTDIDNDALAHARQGIYPRAAVKDVKPKLLRQYFVRHGDDTYQVSKHIREMVVYARQDLVRDPPFSHLDLISCRNVLIYFNSALQKRLIPLFHYVLLPNGFLFLGKSETVGEFTDLFEPLDKHNRIFSRKPGSTGYPVNFAGMDHGRHTFEERHVAPAIKEPVTAEALMDQTIVEQFSTPGVLVDEKYNVLLIRGNVSAFLNLAPGVPKLNLLSLIRQSLRVEISTLLHKCKRECIPMCSHGLKEELDGQADQLLTIHVVPVNIQDNAPFRMAVFFRLESVPDQVLADWKREKKETHDPRIAELEQELVASREHLQTTVEELETSNEELQSINEELQSANEELHSTNEELETSNEELQSTNEELITVNQELQVKSTELAATNSDLENIQRSLDMPMLVVDKQLRITRFTPAANRVFVIGTSDIDQVITTIGSRVELPRLWHKLQRVIGAEQESSEDIAVGADVFHMRISPYYSEHGQVAGAILLFFDVSKLRGLEGKIEAISSTLLRTLNHLDDCFIGIDEQGQIEYVNAACERLFGYKRSELIGRNVHMLMPEPYRSQHDRYIRHYLATGEAKVIGKGREIIGLHKDGTRFRADLSLNEVRMQHGRKAFFGIIRDLSETHRIAPDRERIATDSPVES